MKLNEQDNGQGQDESVARQYIAGLIDTIKNWDKLDPEARQQALINYGYTLGVAIGAPAVGIAAFLARM